MVCWTCIAVWLTIGGVIGYFFFFKRNKKQVELRKKDWKPDTVYLYQFPRTKTIPNLSPFCLKVETFLRVNKIPFEICPLMMGRSQYGLLPFIELNGEHIADSQIIINRLKDDFKVKPLASPRDEASARAIERMIENHTAFVMYRFKAIEDPNNEFLEMILQELGCPAALLPIVVTPAGWLLRPKANKRITATIGQFPVEHFKDFLRKDLNTYRDLLGDKNYFFGDEISSADCTVFAHLATLLYIPPNNYAKETILDGYPELFNYCNRIRDTVFGKQFAEE